MDKQLMTIQGVKGFIDENGMAHLNLEDVARGLGFTEIKGDCEYVRWGRVIEYLDSLNFSTSGENGDTYQKTYSSSMNLYNMVKSKTGYISDNLFKEALQVAKSRKAEYQHLTEAEQLEYIANIMAVWVINEGSKRK
jgi:hypothetical protein